MSIRRFDLRHEAKVHALQAGYRSLSEVARRLGLSRSRLDDLFTGRSCCDARTLEALVSSLAWKELRGQLIPRRDRLTGESKGVTAGSAGYSVKERAINAYSGPPRPRPSFEVVSYPEDLPAGIPLWAVVVIEQARSMGRRLSPEAPEVSESWALAAIDLLRTLAPELERERARKRAGRSRRRAGSPEPSKR